ncbi:MAG TPA: hypothetical protein VJQ85_02220 [Gaiellaceae bacterium]|nr:hypothetical protein [Gaiellaceae bacterium]
MSTAIVELARRQTVFREVNENIARLTDLVAETDYQLFVCECSNTGCAESLELTGAEYEQVRAHGAHFVVIPGHELEEVERVVAGNGRYAVVEKVGAAAQVALADDPRHR